MTAALIALFMSLAICAVIGWAFVRALGTFARRLRRRSASAPRPANDPTIVFRVATAQELAERARIMSAPASAGDVETYFEGGRWKNKVRGNSRASNVHETKAAAVRAGREMARKRRVDHHIHSKDGALGERNSYRHEPRAVPG